MNKKGKIAHQLSFTHSKLYWEGGKDSETIPNDGVYRYLNLAYLDQNTYVWQLAIDQAKRKDYTRGWYKADIVISSLDTTIKPYKLELEVVIGYGERERPPAPLNLRLWKTWQSSFKKQIQQASDKDDSQT